MEKQKNKRVRKESQKAKRERISVENRLARLIGKDADFKENPGNIFEVPLQEVLLATIRVDTPWLRKAIESFNFNVSLNDLKRRSDLFIDKVEASRKSDRHEENMFFHGVKAKVERLVDIYIDASQELNGNRKSAIFEKGQLASPDTRYWKSLLRLNSVLGSLGIRDETEIRMYIKGVSLKKGIKYKMVPIMTLGSHFCVLDFLIFLKEVWYERHATSKHESLYRWRDFGQSYYLKTANQALGLLKSNIECNRGSVFSAEIPSSLGFGADSEQFIAYYLYSCSVFGYEFWKQGWLRKLNPGMHDRVSLLDDESRINSDLKSVLVVAHKAAVNEWENSGIPWFTEHDEDNLLWVTEDPDLQKEMWDYLQNRWCYESR